MSDDRALGRRPSHPRVRGTIEFEGFDLGEAAGSVEVGVTRARVKPGKQSSPIHVEVAEEEIFFVLDGTGLSWQNGETFEVRAGDCIVHPVPPLDPWALSHPVRAGHIVSRPAGTRVSHALRGGDRGLTMLA
jgi:uncharacterized cupin superfamily protein